MNISVCLALIHNNNELRNDYIIPKIDELISNMMPISAKKIMISYQSEIKPHGLAMAFIRDIIYHNLGCKWSNYRLLQSHKLRGTVHFFWASFVKYILSHNGVANRWKRNSAVEVAVTDKHIRAWSQFLDSGADYLIVFEDDAVFNNDSAVRLNELLNTLSKNHQNKPCYVDLGGGLCIS